MRYVLEPKIHVLLVADDGREFRDPPLFAVWLGTIKGKAGKLLENSRMDERQCRDYWDYLGRIDPCPKWLDVFLNRSEIEAAFPVDRSKTGAKPTV
jgi:hypothetical protein